VRRQEATGCPAGRIAEAEPVGCVCGGGGIRA
jgi:hypothetical protein